MATPTTKERVKEFVHAWFRALDDHKPVQECYDMLADDDLAMYLPETAIWNFGTFKEWYDGVIDVFFDEHHEVQSVDPEIHGDQAEVDVVVRWEARWWEPGTAKSKCVNLVATQRWQVRCSSKNAYDLEIVRYNAEAKPFEFQPGSDPLPLRETKKEPQESSVRAAYQELCNSYRTIDDFRARMLALLPFATGGGMFLLLNSNISTQALQKYAGPVGAFGFAITLGLFAYEIYGIRKCGALIVAGKQMEGLLGMDGQFASRPRGVLRYINEPFAAGIIYPAVMGAWAFLIPLGLQLPTVMAILLATGIFLAGFVGMLSYNRHLERDAQRSVEKDLPA